VGSGGSPSRGSKSLGKSYPGFFVTENPFLKEKKNIYDGGPFRRSGKFVCVVPGRPFWSDRFEIWQGLLLKMLA
jgi:hypothetical protein